VGALVVRRGRCRLHAALVATLSLPACGVLNFHSSFPHAAHDPDLDVSVNGITVAKLVQPEFEERSGLRLGATLTARPGAAWGTPRLNSAARPPCEGGVAATDEATFSGRPGDPAQHTVLTLAAPPITRAAPFVDGSAVLDVPVFPADRTQPRRCLRIPLQVLPAGTEWRATPWMMGLDLRFAFLTRPLRGYEGNALLINLPQGLWVGPWRVAVGFEAGFVDERGVPPAASSSAVHSSVGLAGADLLVDRMLWAGRHVGLDAQLGYDLLATIAPNAQTAPGEAAAYQAATLHGPRVALRFLVLTSPHPEWRGFASPPDATSFGVSAFAGAWWQSSGAAAPSPVVGFSLDGNIGL
jgi:hypothetical protein